MIVRCDAIENYIFQRFTADVSGQIVIWGGSHELYVISLFLCRIELSDTYNKG